jgi:exodeoxyribonuclease VII small subunit
VHSCLGRLTRRVQRAIARGMSQTADTPPIANLSFEDALRALEEVVRRLESGDVPLDDSISLYERGEKLRAACQARLDAAQARIERIVAGPDGGIATRPLDAE